MNPSIRVMRRLRLRVYTSYALGTYRREYLSANDLPTSARKHKQMLATPVYIVNGKRAGRKAIRWIW